MIPSLPADAPGVVSDVGVCIEHERA